MNSRLYRIDNLGTIDTRRLALRGVLAIPRKYGSPGEKIVVFAKTTALVMEE